MTSPDSQPTGSDQKSGANAEAQPKQKWTITPEAFDRLLEKFSANRDEAGRQYERIRARLIRYFEWRAIWTPEDCADKTFNRTARRIDEGAQIDDLIPFIFGVARMVYRETLRSQNDEAVPLDETRESQHRRAPEPVEPDEREACFDLCMQKIAPENQRLILEYYQEERRAKIELRQQIAARLNIELNALRIRAHRIRVTLENCIKQCLEMRRVRNE